jgi:predicted extracellular nuclease
MNSKFYLVLFIVLCGTVAGAQPEKWKNQKYFTIMSYNVENLFDTINDPKKNDNEFTPTSEKQFNSAKYFKKLTMLSEVISSINSNELPELIGLCEIENLTVLNDLVAASNLKPGKYKIVHEEGPDPRGIDCALLYRPDAFTYIDHKTLEVRFPFAKNKRTRDILYVKGLVKKDTLHIFVNHWSSRRGGKEKSEPKRLQNATVLKNQTDSIYQINSEARIIILGDFNDSPSDKSLYEVLEAGKLTDKKNLTNLMYELHNEGKGTYYYRGVYNMIDNLIVSRNLCEKKEGFRLYEPKGWIYNPDYICYTNKNGDKSPNKSYGGKNYFGGYSDHFPIYTIFYEK